jgi:flagellar hook-associated protein 2
MISGIASGSIDTNSIVEQLMSLERRPLLALQAKEAQHQATISLYGQFLGTVTTLKNAVARLQGASALSSRASSSHAAILTATASTTALPGTHELLVTRLASSQSLTSSRSASRTEPVATLAPGQTQKMKISVGGTLLGEISVNENNNSPDGIANAINGLAGRLSAQVIDDGQGFRLVLAATDPGAANRITVEVAEDGINYSGAGGDIDAAGLSRLAFAPTYNEAGAVTGGVAQLSQVRAALNSLLKINGLEVTRSSNQVTDLVPGVTINLLSADANQAVRLTVAKDYEGFRANLNSAVQAYNQLLNQIKSFQNSALGRTTEATTDTLRQSLRSIFWRKHGNFSPAELGLTHDRAGVLSADSTRLDLALTQNEGQALEAVGFLAKAMEEHLDLYINSVLPARRESSEQAIRSLQRSQLAFEQRMDKTEAALRRKYGALEEQLNRYQQTSDFLTRQMENLSRSFGGK